MARASWRNAAPPLLVGLLIVVGLMLVASSRFRRGATLLSAALFLASALRLTLPEERMGWLAVRSQNFDVAFCAGLGGLLLWLVLVE